MDEGFKSVRHDMDEGFKSVRHDMDEGFKSVRHELTDIKSDVAASLVDSQELLNFSGDLYEGGACTQAAYLLKQDGRYMVSRSVKLDHTRITGDISAFQPILSCVEDVGKRDLISGRLRDILAHGYIYNWLGEPTVLKQFECDCFVANAPATILMDGSFRDLSLFLSIDTKRSLSFEVMAKGIHQTLILPAIFIWASRGILNEEEQFLWMSGILFDEKMQEQKLKRARKGDARYDMTEIGKALQRTSETYAQGQVLMPPELGKAHAAEQLLRFEGATKRALKDVAPDMELFEIPNPDFSEDGKEILKLHEVGVPINKDVAPDRKQQNKIRIEIPYPVFSEDVKELFNPYTAVRKLWVQPNKNKEGKTVAQSRAEAAVSLYASLRMLKTLKRVILHMQYSPSKEVFRR